MCTVLHYMVTVTKYRHSCQYVTIKHINCMLFISRIYVKYMRIVTICLVMMKFIFVIETE